MRAPKPQSPSANKKGNYSHKFKKVDLSCDALILRGKQFYIPFYSAGGGLDFFHFRLGSERE
jgi:hypothetical protein